jgi:hypothetical protein
MQTGRVNVLPLNNAGQRHVPCACDAMPGAQDGIGMVAGSRTRVLLDRPGHMHACSIPPGPGRS